MKSVDISPFMPGVFHSRCFRYSNNLNHLTIIMYSRCFRQVTSDVRVCEGLLLIDSLSEEHGTHGNLAATPQLGRKHTEQGELHWDLHHHLIPAEVLQTHTLHQDSGRERPTLSRSLLECHSQSLLESAAATTEAGIKTTYSTIQSPSPSPCKP